MRRTSTNSSISWSGLSVCLKRLTIASNHSHEEVQVGMANSSLPISHDLGGAVAEVDSGSRHHLRRPSSLALNSSTLVNAAWPISDQNRSDLRLWATNPLMVIPRSEERRVGKECRSR